MGTLGSRKAAKNAKRGLGQKRQQPVMGTFSRRPWSPRVATGRARPGKPCARLQNGGEPRRAAPTGDPFRCAVVGAAPCGRPCRGSGLAPGTWNVNATCRIIWVASPPSRTGWSGFVRAKMPPSSRRSAATPAPAARQAMRRSLHVSRNSRAGACGREKGEGPLLQARVPGGDSHDHRLADERPRLAPAEKRHAGPRTVLRMCGQSLRPP